MRTRRFTQTGVLHLIAQVLALALLYAVWKDRPLALDGVLQSVALLALVLLQSAGWVSFFYVQDRVEPEPTGFVLLAYLAGAAAAAIVVLPAEQYLFHLSSWMFLSPTTVFLGATFVRGAILSILIYAIVHYGFQPSAEFDEPVDGMAYGSFIGCGMAAVTTLAYLGSHLSFSLFAMACTGAVNVLVYGSVGALVGYLVGSRKFLSHGGAVAPAVGIVIGAAAIGVYHTIVEYGPFATSLGVLLANLAAAILFAIVIAGLAVWGMYRLTARTAGPVGHATPAFDPLAIGVAIVLLLAGAFVTRADTQSVTFRDARFTITFAYDPIRSTMIGSAPTQAAFRSRGSAGLPLIFTSRTPHDATIAVQQEEAASTVDTLDASRFLRAADPIGLTMTDLTIGGRRAVRLRYAYIAKPSGTSRDLPRLRWAYTDIVPGDRDTYVISFDGDPDAFSRDEAEYGAWLSTVGWSGR